MSVRALLSQIDDDDEDNGSETSYSEVGSLDSEEENNSELDEALQEEFEIRPPATKKSKARYEYTRVASESEEGDDSSSDSEAEKDFDRPSLDKVDQGCE
jgi:hypothetical protein